MDTVSEKRLSLIYPLLAHNVRKMAAILAAENIFIRVTQGLRTWEEQDALYAQGRTRPGLEVTNAKGGQSFHNYGLAVDVVPDEFPDDGKFTPDWNLSHPSWKRIVEVGTSLGMTSGSTFRSRPDEPHFELVGKFPTNAPNMEMAKLYNNGGFDAIWDAVSASYPKEDSANA